MHQTWLTTSCSLKKFTHKTIEPYFKRKYIEIIKLLIEGTNWDKGLVTRPRKQSERTDQRNKLIEQWMSE